MFKKNFDLYAKSLNHCLYILLLIVYCGRIIMLDKNIQNVIKDIRGDEAWEILSANIKAHIIYVRTDA